MGSGNRRVKIAGGLNYFLKNGPVCEYKAELPYIPVNKDFYGDVKPAKTEDIMEFLDEIWHKTLSLESKNLGVIKVSYWTETPKDGSAPYECLSYEIGGTHIFHTGHAGFIMYLRNGGLVTKLIVNGVEKSEEERIAIIERILKEDDDMKVSLDIEIKLPRTPNFLQTGAQDPHKTVPVEEFTVAQLSALADLWKEELIKKAKDYKP